MGHRDVESVSQQVVEEEVGVKKKISILGNIICVVHGRGSGFDGMRCGWICCMYAFSTTGVTVYLILLRSSHCGTSPMRLARMRYIDTCISRIQNIDIVTRFSLQDFHDKILTRRYIYR